MALRLALAALLVLAALAQARCVRCAQSAQRPLVYPGFAAGPSRRPPAGIPTSPPCPSCRRELLAPKNCNGAKKAMCGTPPVCTNLQVSAQHCE